MKKFIALLLAGLMVLSLAACGQSGTVSEEDAESVANEIIAMGESVLDDVLAMANEDVANVTEAGKLVVGITDFEPMDYQENGEWIGFDADMAKAFAESLGVEVEFVEIEWDNKVLELDSGAIDCVWNGMTLNDEVMAAMDCSNAYCNNAQIVIVPKDKAADYQTEESVKGLVFAVEAGSVGAEAADALGTEKVEVTNQAATLMEVKAGTADAAIIDSLMAAAMVGEGTSYEDLAYTVKLTTEEYGVGFRRGSDLVEKLNQFFKDAYADGSMQECAETYGIQAALIEQ